MHPLILKLLFLILVSILSIKYILFWTYIWQLKEYRWDRLKDFLNSSEGRKAFFNIFYLGKIICAVLGFISFGLIFFTLGFGGKGLTYEKTKILILFSNFVLAIICFFLFFETAIYLKHISEKTTKHPVLTKKTLLLMLIAGFINFYLIILLYLNLDKEFFAPLSLVILLYSSAFIGLANLLIYPFSYILKEWQIKKAASLMRNFDGTVIGITGSYGKSSVKEYCAGLLKQKFEVIKTPKNVNTDIGVANYLISLKSKVKSQKLRNGFFICEMGAYRIGEIKKLCGMARPEIGILTGINEQHIALFGNIENTIKAKSELIQSLPKGGIAIINNDDETCRSISIQDGIKKITYGFSVDSDFSIKQKGESAFIVKHENEEFAMASKVVWKHNIQNLLPAIITARHGGMGWDEIKEAVENLEQPENGMKLTTIRKAAIIDDTYNSNPTGVKAALEVLDSIERKHKILVLDDIWELGKESKRIHRELAKIIAGKNYSKIILTGKNYAGFMKNELLKNGVSAGNVAAEIILSDYLKIDSAILFEGRMSKKFLIHLISNSPNKNLKILNSKNLIFKIRHFIR